MIDTTAVISDHIATWNEREPQQRRALVERMFTENAVYTDPHRSGTGSAEIDAMIETGQEQSPGHHIDLTSGPEGHNDSVRFAWQLVGPDGPIGGGTDFGTLAPDGRLAHVTGLLRPRIVGLTIINANHVLDVRTTRRQRA